MDFVPDYELAKKEVRDAVFGTYSSAYVITNEDLRTSMDFVPADCKNALVVAASGDHPLFCSLYGAKNVDTFDISYNAKCIMDVKVAALQCLEYLEYVHFVDDLHDNSVNLKDIKNIDKVLHKLPKTEYNYICALSNLPIFYRRSVPITYMGLPTEIEYSKLRKNIKKPYNFILSDICKLSASLTKSYDFIHLSNIFDYVRGGDYEKVITSLMNHVNPGGRIVTQFFVEGNDQIFGFCMSKIVNNQTNWTWKYKKIELTPDTIIKNGVNVLERIR